jgi:hypothetical protein
VVDRDGVEHATLAEPVSPSVEYLHPLDVAGFQSGEFGVLRLTFADPSPVLTRYDAGGALLDAIPIVVEGNPSGIVPQPGRFAIASRAVGGDEAWLTGFDADGAAQWQKPARHASSIATTPDGSIGMRWNDSTAEVPYGLAAYDPLGEPLFEATIGDDSVISEIVGGVDGFWVMVWGAQSRLTHFGLDGTSTDVATVEGAGFQITAMPDGDATVVYSAGDIEYVARIGYDGTTRWTTQMPDGIEVWNLAAGPDGFVWVIGQDDYDVDVAARSYLWGIAP